jgi:hypothetical protein
VFRWLHLRGRPLLVPSRPVCAQRSMHSLSGHGATSASKLERKMDKKFIFLLPCRRPIPRWRLNPLNHSNNEDDRRRVATSRPLFALAGPHAFWAFARSVVIRVSRHKIFLCKLIFQCPPGYSPSPDKESCVNGLLMDPGAAKQPQQPQSDAISIPSGLQKPPSRDKKEQPEKVCQINGE